MVTILPALGQVREDLVKILDRKAVEEVCRALGYYWRDRQLDPWTTLHLFILQVLHNNTAMSEVSPQFRGIRHGEARAVHEQHAVPSPERPFRRPVQLIGKPQSRPRWMTREQYFQLPDRILVREIKWRIRERYRRVREVTLVTTLLDPQRYPAAEIARLYERRWQVEVDLRDLKITLGMDVLKGHKVDTVTKELLVFLKNDNLVRLVTVRAAKRQRVKPYRISFIDALRWLQPPKLPQPLPILITNPVRPDRLEPRCIKRRPKEYPVMKWPRRELRKRLKKRRDAA